MVQIVGYHVTRTACRESIRQNGLLPNRPTQARPYGVYVFRMDGGFDHAARNLTEWTHYHNQDMWEVPYCGPLTWDPYVLNALIFLRPVERVTLVTGNQA